MCLLGAMKALVALDFDHTVVDDNTDTYVMKLSTGGVLPKEVEVKMKAGFWTDFMNEVFKYLHEQCHVRKKDYERTLAEIPLTPGFLDLFKFFQENNRFIDCIIISDSNEWFIDFILELHGIRDVAERVFTNEAKFEQNSLLRIFPHHQHDHKACPVNMCKRKVLENYIAEKKSQGVVYSHIFYVGDGGNDYCPATILTENDTLFAREGYSLHRKLVKLQEKGESLVTCNVNYWKGGQEILSTIKDVLGK